MALRVTEETRSYVRDMFINDNPRIIGDYVTKLLTYAHSKKQLSDVANMKKVFYSNDRVEDIASSILFLLATTEPGTIPLQSLAGSIAPMISATDLMEDRIVAMQIAMEVLIASAPYAQFTFSRNGYPMIESMISNQEMILKNIALPLEQPTRDHKKLGSYDWELEEVPALDMLNNIPLRIVNIKDEEPPLPSGLDRFTPENLKQAEMHKKWQMRQWLKEEYKNKKLYFNWAADYRVRMYPVGYYLNPQGSELEKNMLAFADGEKLNFYGVQQYKMSIASAYGLDKETDDVKKAWFEKNRDVLHLRQNNAKEPHTFNALMIGWKQHLNSEKVDIPVELDATNSQAQMMAILLKSKTIAETCNVINVTNDEGKIVIADLYKLVADEMSDILAERKIQVA